MTVDLRPAYRPLGQTGLDLSPLGLAGLSFGTKGLPNGVGMDATTVERAFHELGVNFFFYSPRMSGLREGLRRLIAAGHRDQLVIAAAVALPFGWGVRHAFKRQARILGTDYLDVLLLGWVRARWHTTGDTWRALQVLKEQGKTRAIGFSCHDRTLARALNEELQPDVMMLRYNAAHRGAESQIFPHLGERRPGIIAYTATRWGKLLEPLPARGFPQGMTAPECYRFALSHAAVNTVLCAARSWTELEEDARAVVAGPLPAERLAEVRNFGDAVHAAARGGQRFMFR